MGPDQGPRPAVLSTLLKGRRLTEVVIDTLTGENRILRCDILHDAGHRLNPALDIGQIEGGYVQGAGWLTTEELVWDDKGNLRTHAPSTYKIPACSDRPAIFNVALWDGAEHGRHIRSTGPRPWASRRLCWDYRRFSRSAMRVAACGPAYPDLNAPATAEHVLAAIKRARNV